MTYFKQLYTDWLHINRNFKALLLSTVVHAMVFMFILIFWEGKTIDQPDVIKPIRIIIEREEPPEEIIEPPEHVIEENIPVRTEPEKTITKTPEKPSPKPEPPAPVEEPVPDKVPTPVTTPQRQRNVEPRPEKREEPKIERERIVIEREERDEFDIPIDDFFADFDRPDIEYNPDKSEDIISDRRDILSERLLTEHSPMTNIPVDFEYEEIDKVRPDRRNVIDDVIREGINFDRQVIVEFDRFSPVNTERPEYSSVYYVTERQNIPVRELLRSPDMPAPDWLEEKGVITHIVFDGIVNEQGRLIRADIIQMSPYYKLDIAARDFVMKNWRWEQANYRQQVRIQLAVYLKR